MLEIEDLNIYVGKEIISTTEEILIEYGMTEETCQNDIFNHSITVVVTSKNKHFISKIKSLEKEFDKMEDVVVDRIFGPNGDEIYWGLESDGEESWEETLSDAIDDSWHDTDVEKYYTDKEGADLLQAIRDEIIGKIQDLFSPTRI